MSKYGKKLKLEIWPKYSPKSDSEILSEILVQKFVLKFGQKLL